MTEQRLSADASKHLEEIYRTHYRALRKVLLIALHGDGTRADDVYQDVILKVFMKHIADLHTKSTAEQFALLRAAAVNRVIDLWRSDRRTVFEAPGSGVDAALDRRGSTIDEFAQVENRLLLSEFIDVAMRRLSVSEFRVVFLGWYMDRTDAEIAEKLGTTAQTVRAHRYRARKKIATFARRNGYEIVFSDDPDEAEPPTFGTTEETA